MDDKEMIRKLNSVGKTVFIQYFTLFESYAKMNISRESVIEKLVKDGVSNENGAAIRCGNAKRIFDENQECNALEVAVSSNRLSVSTINFGKSLMVEKCS